MKFILLLLAIIGALVITVLIISAIGELITPSETDSDLPKTKRGFPLPEGSERTEWVELGGGKSGYVHFTTVYNYHGNFFTVIATLGYYKATGIDELFAAAEQQAIDNLVELYQASGAPKRAQSALNHIELE